MSGCCLGQFNVLGLVIEVREDGCPKPDGCDVLPKAGLPLNPLTHPADLGIGEGLISAKQKSSVYMELLKIGECQSRETNRAVTAAGLGTLDLRPVAGGMGHGAPYMNSHVGNVYILGGQPQHFLQPERVEGL